MSSSVSIRHYALVLRLEQFSTLVQAAESLPVCALAGAKQG